MTDDLTIKIGANADSVRDVSQTVEDLLDRWAMNIDSFDGAEANLDISGFGASTKTASEAIEELLAKVETLRGLEFVDSDSAQLDQTVEALNELKGRADELSKIEITFLDDLGKNLDGLGQVNAALGEAQKAAAELERIESAFAKADAAAKPVKKTIDELNAEIKASRAEADKWTQSFSNSEKGAVNVRDELSDVFGLIEDSRSELEGAQDTLDGWVSNFDELSAGAEEVKDRLTQIEGLAAGVLLLLQQAVSIMIEAARVDILGPEIKRAEILRQKIIEANSERAKRFVQEAGASDTVDEEIKKLEELVRLERENVKAKEAASALARQPAPFGRPIVQGTDSDPVVRQLRASEELVAAQNDLKNYEDALESVRKRSSTALKEFNEDLERQRLALDGNREELLKKQFTDQSFGDADAEEAARRQIAFEEERKLKLETQATKDAIEQQKASIEQRNKELQAGREAFFASRQQGGTVDEAQQSANEAIQRERDLASLKDENAVKDLARLRAIGRAQTEAIEKEKQAQGERDKNAEELANKQKRRRRELERDLERLDRDRERGNETVGRLENRREELQERRGQVLGGFDSGIEALTGRIANAASGSGNGLQDEIREVTKKIESEKNANERTDRMIAGVQDAIKKIPRGGMDQ